MRWVLAYIVALAVGAGVGRALVAHWECRFWKRKLDVAHNVCKNGVISRTRDPAPSEE